MFSAFLHGILLGGLLSILIGPVFFMLIKTSIQDGFRDAMYLEAGIFLSDIFCITVSYLGLAQLFMKPENEKIILLCGGLILLVFGIIGFFSRKKMTDPDAPEKKTPVHKLMLKGFFFNLSNPSVLLFWIGAVGITVSQYKSDVVNVTIYFVGTLLTVSLIDVLKALLAVRIKTFLTPKMFIRINKISSLAILGFGVFLLVKAIW
jgi:threonine/homoserine/homoserine lactone efflux protein